MSVTTPKNRPLVALRALRALSQDPDDLPRVFTIIESLPGRAPQRTLGRMRRSPSGRALLAERPSIAPLLSDRGALAALPAGSLGRAYLAFAEREQISAQGILDANDAGRLYAEGEVDADDAFMADRMRDTHDLWHVVTGYGADLRGETAVLAFSYAQTRHPGVALVIGLAVLRRVPGIVGLVRDAYRRGARASFLPAVRWEELLARPLAEVRAELGVEPAPPYERLESATLRAEGKLPPSPKRPPVREHAAAA